MDQAQIERNLIRCRLLLTRSAVHRLGLRSIEDIQRNFATFIRECHSCFKRAARILIDDMLSLEKLVAETDKRAPDRKQRLAKYRYWLRLLEHAYDSFVWIAANHDRSEVLKTYKGPKHGALAKQNIQSVVTVADQMNRQPEALAIPLDFSRFSCISDLLRIRRHPNGRVTQDFIEVKEGSVNEELHEVIAARSIERYQDFFDRYGEKGIEQIERVFKQSRIANQRVQLFGKQPGIYQEEAAVRIVTEMRAAPEDSYLWGVEDLIGRARANEYSVETIDDCLVIAALNGTSEKDYTRTDFVQRCVVHAGFGDNSLTGDQDALLKALQGIPLLDWRRGFNSPACVPPLLQPLSTRSLLDLLFGRVQLHFYFDGSAFIRLCTNQGVRAGFLKRRTTNRLKSTRGWREGDVMLFGGRAIGCIANGFAFILGPEYLDEVFFNWRTPSAIVRHMKQMEGEIAQMEPSLLDEVVSGNPFSEKDLEPA